MVCALDAEWCNLGSSLIRVVTLCMCFTGHQQIKCYRVTLRLISISSREK